MVSAIVSLSHADFLTLTSHTMPLSPQKARPFTFCNYQGLNPKSPISSLNPRPQTLNLLLWPKPGFLNPQKRSDKEKLCPNPMPETLITAHAGAQSSRKTAACCSVRAAKGRMGQQRRCRILFRAHGVRVLGSGHRMSTGSSLVMRGSTTRSIFASSRGSPYFTPNPEAPNTKTLYLQIQTPQSSTMTPSTIHSLLS